MESTPAALPVHPVNLKKIFLKALVISLCISALIGIILFVIGDFREFEMRILGTTLAVGAYSLIGLCTAVLYDSGRFRLFGAVGIAASVIGFLLLMVLLWEIIDFEEMWKAALICFICAATMAHMSLLLLIRPPSKLVEMAQIATLCFIVIVAALFVTVILTEFHMRFMNQEVFVRLLGVVAILDVLGTIATPILRKMAVLKE